MRRGAERRATLDATPERHTASNRRRSVGVRAQRTRERARTVDVQHQEVPAQRERDGDEAFDTLRASFVSEVNLLFVIGSVAGAGGEVNLRFVAHNVRIRCAARLMMWGSTRIKRSSCFAQQRRPARGCSTPAAGAPGAPERVPLDLQSFGDAFGESAPRVRVRPTTGTPSMAPATAAARAAAGALAVAARPGGARSTMKHMSGAAPRRSTVAAQGAKLLGAATTDKQAALLPLAAQPALHVARWGIAPRPARQLCSPPAARTRLARATGYANARPCGRVCRWWATRRCSYTARALRHRRRGRRRSPVAGPRRLASCRSTGQAVVLSSARALAPSPSFSPPRLPPLPGPHPRSLRRGSGAAG